MSKNQSSIEEVENPSGSASKLRGYATTLICGLAGAGLFLWLSLPMPWLLGSIFGTLIGSNLPGLTPVKPRALSNSVRMLLGVAIGTHFTPALVNEIGSYTISILLFIPSVLIFVAIGFWYFNRICRFPSRTAYFCSLPGGMLEMALICEAYGARISQVAVVQTTRVLLIVYTVPLTLQYFTPVDLTGRIRTGPPLTSFPLEQAPLLIAGALTGWWLLRRMGLPGASIVGPMLICGLMYSLGITDAHLPDELINLAQWILGAGVGTSFIGIRLREMANLIAVTVGYYLILIFLALITAFLVHWLTGIVLLDTVLAYIPGGQAEMNVIAITAGALGPYVALHHMLRMVMVMTIAPPVSRWLFGPPAKSV